MCRGEAAAHSMAYGPQVSTGGFYPTLVVRSVAVLVAWALRSTGVQPGMSWGYSSEGAAVEGQA